MTKREEYHRDIDPSEARDWFNQCVGTAAAGHAIPPVKVLCTANKALVPATARLEVVRHFRERFPKASRPYIAGLFADRAAMEDGGPYKTPDQSTITCIIRRIERANAEATADNPQPVGSGVESLAQQESP